MIGVDILVIFSLLSTFWTVDCDNQILLTANFEVFLILGLFEGASLPKLSPYDVRTTATHYTTFRFVIKSFKRLRLVHEGDLHFVLPLVHLSRAIHLPSNVKICALESTPPILSILLQTYAPFQSHVNAPELTID